MILLQKLMYRPAAGLVVLLFCLLGLSACGSVCRDKDKNCLADLMHEHVVNREDFWAPSLQAPLDRRFAAAPPELVDFLTLENRHADFPQRPVSAAIPEDFRQDLQAAMAELPPPVTRALEQSLAGVYFVRGLGSTGFTNRVLNSRGEAVAAYVVLDLGELSGRSANAWATWKENTPFKFDPGHALEATIETPAQDNRKNAIQYILLHEFGHVLPIGRSIHPPWWIKPAPADASVYPFFALSWEYSAGAYISRFDGSFDLRRRAVYYRKPLLEANERAAAYMQLEQTNLPTLYAATNPYDDFAESFANYVHTVVMGKPYEIRIIENGQVVKQVHSCWEQPRCQEKRRTLERILGAL